MKRPLRLRSGVYVDLAEVAVVEQGTTLESGTRYGFGIVLRSGYKTYESITASGNYRTKLQGLREVFMEVLLNPIDGPIPGEAYPTD